MGFEAVALSREIHRRAPFSEARSRVTTDVELLIGQYPLITIYKTGSGVMTGRAWWYRDHST